MKSRILDLLEKGPKTFNELKVSLNFKNLRKLDLLLRELQNDKKIFFRKGPKTYNIKRVEEEIIGTFSETKNGYGFVENDDISVFIPARFCLNAIHKDTVKVSLFPVREGEDPERRSGRIVRVMQRNGSEIIGRVQLEENKKVFVPDELFSKYEFTLSGVEEYEIGDILVTKFVDFVNGIIQLSLVKYIGKTSDATLDVEILSRKFELDTTFSKEALEEAEQVKPIDSDRRVDLTNELVYTIDGEESKDLDDAISIKILNNGNYKLLVHIADVSHMIKKDSTLDKEAVERGNSIYLINTVFPMLPKKISNELCSLNPNTMKFTMTCEMEIDKNANVLNSKIYESKINSDFRLTYSEVDKLYNGEIKVLRDSKELSESLWNAKKLADIIRKQKIDNGMIDFVLPESKLKLDEKGEVIDIKNKFQTTSEKVIEDLMVVTNETVAKTLSSKKLPAMFRIHPKPTLENLENFSRLLNTIGLTLPKNINDIKSKDLMIFLQENSSLEIINIIKRYMIQTMEKAIYSYENRGHYALGLSNYLHFTSPIRRYSDLVVHRLIKEYFIDDNANKNISLAKDTIPYLEELGKDLSERERVSVQIERKLVDIKKSRYMKDNVFSTYEGTIVSIVKFGIFVEFDSLVQGLIHIDTLGDNYSFDEDNYKFTNKETKKTYKVGDKINVKISNVNIAKGAIDLEVI